MVMVTGAVLASVPDRVPEPDRMPLLVNEHRAQLPPAPPARVDLHLAPSGRVLHVHAEGGTSDLFDVIRGRTATRALGGRAPERERYGYRGEKHVPTGLQCVGSRPWLWDKSDLGPVGPVG